MITIIKVFFTICSLYLFKYIIIIIALTKKLTDFYLCVNENVYII